MTKPTKASIEKMKEDLVADLRTLSQHLDLSKPEVDHAFASLQTFYAIALRVMAKTNFSKLRDEFMAVEIATLMSNKVVLDV